MIVFISGSSKIKKLTEDMQKCLDKYIEQKVSFIVGDCYGADELAQEYLKSKNYEDVTVYCSQEKPHQKRCRYDKYISLWEQAQGKEGEEFYQVKDKAMCEACDVAVAFWNGSSYGVKCNILRCIDAGKECEIYISDAFDTLDLSEIVAKSNEKVYIKLYKVPNTSLPIDIITKMPYKVDWLQEK
jgi:hypothetical protein